MFYAAIFLMGILIPLTSGVPLETAVPLEDPSADFSQFFDSRIVGGSEAADGSAPWMVALLSGLNWFVCGGSIITDRHIVTAAHCVMVQWNGELMSDFRAAVGSNNWSTGTIVVLKGFCNHPQYDAFRIKNDIGVLITEKKINFNKRVAVIALNCDRVGAGVKSFVTGWGTERLWGAIPNLLQTLNVTTISAKECDESVRDLIALTPGGTPPPIDHDLEICTYHSPGHGMCHGDSGSALVIIKFLKQIGVVSWGFPCAIGAPDFFVRISFYCDFIFGVIKHGCDGCRNDQTLNLE